jgi:hypothetical protein
MDSRSFSDRKDKKNCSTVGLAYEHKHLYNHKKGNQMQGCVVIAAKISAWDCKKVPHLEFHMIQSLDIDQCVLHLLAREHLMIGEVSMDKGQCETRFKLLAAVVG